MLVFFFLFCLTFFPGVGAAAEVQQTSLREDLAKTSREQVSERFVEDHSRGGGDPSMHIGGKKSS